MPIYEYGCKACHRQFEYEQRMSDDEKTVCEACGGELERLISRTAFSLKGGGWYKDLYSSTKPAAATPTESKSETKTETKTDSSATPSTPSTPSTPTTPSSPSSDKGGTGGGSGTSKAAAAES